MVSGLFFNFEGVTHSVELELFDGVSVWRAIVDGYDVVFVDAGLGLSFRGLLNRVVEEWVAVGV